MHPTPALYELLYVSAMAPSGRYAVVGEIARKARTKNKPLHVTGLLVFDGERYCQHLEGTMQDVLELYKRISEDPRHTDVVLLNQGEVTQRKFGHFAMAFANIDEGEALDAIGKLRGAAASEAFSVLCLSLDMSP